MSESDIYFFQVLIEWYLNAFTASAFPKFVKLLIECVLARGGEAEQLVGMNFISLYESL
jgi:hypothetical protein